MKVLVASTFFQRGLGLIPMQFHWSMGRFREDRDSSSVQPHTLLFPCCQSLHTFVMTRCVDVAFIDARNRVLKRCQNLPPMRVVSCKGAHAALERFSQTSQWPEKGETLTLEAIK